MDADISNYYPNILQEFEIILLHNATMYAERTEIANQVDEWSCPIFQNMLARRRQTTIAIERRGVTNEIRKYVRKQLRRKKSVRFNAVLAEFADLNKLDNISHLPIRIQRSVNSNEPTPNEFADFFE